MYFRLQFGDSESTKKDILPLIFLPFYRDVISRNGNGGRGGGPVIFLSR